MAGFTSMDDLISKMTVSGQSLRKDWNKNFLTAVAIAGEWHCMMRGTGNPPADTVMNTGTNLAFQALSDTTAGANTILHGGNVSPATKHVVNASVYSAAATTAPAVYMLVDMLGFYRLTSVTTTGNQATNNTVTLPRYTDGVGVQAFAYVNTTTAMGAATPNLSITYTNSAGTAGKTTPATLPACKTGATSGHIPYSGTAAGKFGPFIPLAAGDTGIRSIQQINLSASYVSGELAVVLCKPLLTMPVAAIGVAAERDFVNQLPSLPKIEDGAALMWLMYSGAATPASSSVYGHLDFAWG
jgi:hypothetical protein